MTRTIARWILAAGLGAIGVLHFVQTRGFRVVVPDWATRMSGLDKETIVVASGAVEIALGSAIALAPSQHRRKVGLAAAAFFVAIFPGNLSQFVHGRDGFGLDSDGKRFVRLFFQPALVAWAL